MRLSVGQLVMGRFRPGFTHLHCAGWASWRRLMGLRLQRLRLRSWRLGFLRKNSTLPGLGFSVQEEAFRGNEMAGRCVGV